MYCTKPPPEPNTPVTTDSEQFTSKRANLIIKACLTEEVKHICKYEPVYLHRISPLTLFRGTPVI